MTVFLLWLISWAIISRFSLSDINNVFFGVCSLLLRKITEAEKDIMQVIGTCREISLQNLLNHTVQNFDKGFELWKNSRMWSLSQRRDVMKFSRADWYIFQSYFVPKRIFNGGIPRKLLTSRRRKQNILRTGQKTLSKSEIPTPKVAR